jgi:predicted RNA-binding protein YlxR (DUF448 family)
VACGKKSEKRGLVRIVASSKGQVEMDPSGKMNGRGAYICVEGCTEDKKLRRSRLEHALRVNVADADWNKLVSQLRADDE